MYTLGVTFHKFGYSFTPIITPDGKKLCVVQAHEAEELLKHLNR